VWVVVGGVYYEVVEVGDFVVGDLGFGVGDFVG